jgi:hypothetical protein
VIALDESILSAVEVVGIGAAIGLIVIGTGPDIQIRLTGDH